LTEAESLRLVVDTSVAVKWYLPEELGAEAVLLLDKSGAGEVELISPATVQPEFFNALRQQRRRENLPVEELQASWEAFSTESVTLYAPEDLMPRAAEIALETEVIVYDALFLALAEDANTVMTTADDKLLRRLEGTNFASLALHLASVERVL
jgi:predicted nucleic acid-binding protein